MTSQPTPDAAEQRSREATLHSPRAVHGVMPSGASGGLRVLLLCRRYAWLLIALPLLTLLLQYVSIPDQPARYTVRTRVMIGDEPMLSLPSPMAQMGFSRRDTRYIETMVAALKSGEVLRRVADRLALADHPQFRDAAQSGGSADKLGHVVLALQRRLTAKQVERTRLADVTYIGTDPELAVKVLNCLGEVFLEWETERDIASAGKIAAYIQSQREKLESDVESVEKEIADLVSRESLAALSPGDRAGPLGLAHASRRVVDAAIAKLEAQKRLDLAKEASPGSAVEVETARAREDAAREVLRDLEGKARERARAGARLAALQRKLADRRSAMATLLENTHESGALAELLTLKSRVVSAAVRPRSPVAQHHGRELAQAFGVGLVLAIGLVFALDLLDGSVRTVADVEESVGTPFLGAASHVGMPQPVPGAARPLLAEHCPRADQSFRMLWQHVRPAAGSGGACLVVASPSHKEGRTTVAVDLAAAAARAGQRVLLVDGDLRSPDLHERMGGERSPGLAEVLAGEVEPGEATRETGVEGLFLLPAGAERPGRGLDGGGLGRLTEWASAAYDVVLFDSPALCVVADGAALAEAAGAVLFVARAGRTSCLVERRWVEQMRHLGVEVLGTFINDVRGPQHDYLLYGSTRWPFA